MTAGASATVGDGSAGSGVLAKGRVLSVRSDAADTTVVSLVVSEESAALLMSAAGTGGVGLVLLAGE
jgi:hypothetical protein